MILFLIPCSLLIFFFFFSITRSSKKLPLPPGPYPWPIVGNLFQMGKNAHIRLAEMAQVHGQLMSLRIGQLIFVVGSSPAAASEILKNHDNALSGREVTRSLQEESSFHNMNLAFTSESGDDWRKIRNIYISNIFSSKAMVSRAHIRETKVMEMVKYIRSKVGENISIKDVMVVTATNIMSNTTLSMDVMDFEGNGIGAGIKDTVRRLALLRTQPQLADFCPIFGRWDLQGWKKKVMQIIEHEFGDIWKDILERKRNGSHISSGQKDFTDILIERGFTHQQINALMEELFSAGTDSIVSTTEWFVAELLRNQEVMQKARDEVLRTIDRNVVKESDLVHLPFLEACFKETLRLHPPAPLLLPHRAIETCEVMGYTIPKDSQILVNVWAISRDPKIWEDPLSFKPKRFMGSELSSKGKEFEYLPFGAGRRMCPGEPLASKTILLTVASLILNFDWLLVNNMNPEDINMDEVLDLPMQKKEPLHVNLKLRQ
ncbi:probable (S)-N-methylcoclaurine 3'-hydroxylase isozyme 2 [Lactuca sativa]|uniref:probable (S)-N-methylcoclaurine 3'-hydroxylase isozyme 2 n=1 Tax=Lactuca sativa TaxID=4236 RepID=UPI000CC094C6|nr:probable (S)-N-methylcoclaurine 3'-hydroxylase isozyme 2 [Lactuca sativa]